MVNPPILQYLQEGPWLTHFQYVPQFFGVWWWKSVYLSVEDLTCDSFMGKADVEVDGALVSPRKHLRFTQRKCGCHSVTGFFVPFNQFWWFNGRKWCDNMTNPWFLLSKILMFWDLEEPRCGFDHDGFLIQWEIGICHGHHGIKKKTRDGTNSNPKSGMEKNQALFFS